MIKKIIGILIILFLVMLLLIITGGGDLQDLGIIGVVLFLSIVTLIWRKTTQKSEENSSLIKILFRIISFLEGVSYILLMSVGLYFKYQLEDPSYVKLLGMPHGLFFISYIILAFLIKDGEQWENKDFGVILLASILPFGTFYVDWKYLRELKFKKGI